MKPRARGRRIGRLKAIIEGTGAPEPPTPLRGAETLLAEDLAGGEPPWRGAGSR